MCNVYEWAKVQQAILKAILSHDVNKLSKYAVIRNYNWVWVCVDNVYMIGMNEDMCYVNVDKLHTPTTWKRDGFIDLLDEAKYRTNADRMKDTHTTKEETAFGKKKCLHIFTVDDKNVYIDEKYLKEMGYDSLTMQLYKPSNSTSCRIYANEWLIGLIAPVNHSD